MAWSAQDIPDLTGRTAVVTGANGGLGLETVRELARKGATVLMAARNQEKAMAAVADITSEVADAALTVIDLDLSSLQSVDRAARSILDTTDSIDILVNNAGVMGIPRRLTEDGHEMQFGTNHLGHFVLTASLMPSLMAAPRARVVTVTSTGRHFRQEIDTEDLTMEGSYGSWQAYGRSKRANFLFAIELDRRLRAVGSPVRSLSAHPGYTHTNLQAHSFEQSGGASHRFFHHTVQWFGMSASHGALPQLRAATDPRAEGGQMYTPMFVNAGPPVRRAYLPSSVRNGDLELLWDVSEAATGVVFDVAAMARDN